jgi:hypothetical protein
MLINFGAIQLALQAHPIYLLIGWVTNEAVYGGWNVLSKYMLTVSLAWRDWGTS